MDIPYYNIIKCFDKLQVKINNIYKDMLWKIEKIMINIENDRIIIKTTVSIPIPNSNERTFTMYSSEIQN